MVQTMTRGETSTAPTGVISVADLLSRYAPATPAVEPEPTTVPVSVGSLLRREGRLPEIVPVPPPDNRYDVEDEPTPGGSGRWVRRGAIAAGTLLAAGSVFGAAVFTDTATRGEGPPTPGDGPGQNRLDARPPAPAGPVPTVDPAALADVLDAGEPASTSWMDLAGGRAADDGAAGGTASGGAAGDGGSDRGADAEDAGSAAPAGEGVAADTVPAGRPADDGGDRRVGSPSGDDRTSPSTDVDAPSGGDGGGRGGETADDGGGEPADDGGGDGLGDRVRDVGESVGGPVGEPVQALGGTVSALGDGVEDTTESTPVRSVGDLAGSLL